MAENQKEQEFGFRLGEKKVWIKARTQEEANDYYRQWSETDAGKEAIAKYGAPEEEPRTTASGIMKSGFSGLVRGAVGTASLPGLAEQLGNWASEGVAGLAGYNVDKPVTQGLKAVGDVLDPVLGSGVVPVGHPEGEDYSSRKESQTFMPTMEENVAWTEDKIGKLYAPKTSAEKFIGTTAEFLSGMALPGGGGATLVKGGVQLGKAGLKKAAAKKLAKKLAESRADDVARHAAGLSPKLAPPGAGAAAQAIPKAPGTALGPLGQTALSKPGTGIGARIVEKAGGIPASGKTVHLGELASEAAEAATKAAQAGKSSVRHGLTLGSMQAAAGVGSEAGGQLTEGTAWEPWMRIAGGIVGGYAPSLVGRTISPGAITSDDSFKQYKDLKERGVEMSPGMQTQSKPLQSIEGMFATVPYGADPMAKFDESFSKAVLRTTGMTDDMLSRLDDYSRERVLSLIREQKENLSKVFQDAYKTVDIEIPAMRQRPLSSSTAVAPRKTPTQIGDDWLQAETLPENLENLRSLLSGIYQEVDTYMDLIGGRGASASKLPPGVADLYERMDYFRKTGRLKGEQWDNLRKNLAFLGSRTKDPQQRELYKQLTSKIDDFVIDAAAEGNVVPTIEMTTASGRETFIPTQDALKRARNRWRNTKILEDTLAKADEKTIRGQFNPKNLRSATNKRNPNASNLPGDLGELVEKAKEFYTPYNDTGSASRIMSQGTLQQMVTQVAMAPQTTSGVGGAGVMAIGGASLANAPLIVVGMLAGYAAPGGVARIYNKPAVQAYLTNQAGRKFMAWLTKNMDDIRVNEVGDLIATNPRTAVGLNKHLAAAKKIKDRDLLKRAITAHKDRVDMLEATGNARAPSAFPFDKELQKDIRKFNRGVRIRQIADRMRRGQAVIQGVDTPAGRAGFSQDEEY